MKKKTKKGKKENVPVPVRPGSATAGAHLRRRGRGQEGQEAAAGDDEVVRQLRDQVDGVDDEDGALAAVDELQHRLTAVTVRDK